MADDRDETTKALAKPPPSDRALVKSFLNRVADSPRSIQPGELVLLDRKGTVYGRKQFNRTLLLYRVGVYGALIGGALLWSSGAVIPGLLVYASGMFPVLSAKYRGTARLVAIDTLARSGQLEEAERRLAESAGLRRRNPAAYARVAASLASHRGDHDAALRSWREAVPRLRGFERSWVRLAIARSLAIQGKHVEAEREVDGIALPDGVDEVMVGLLRTKLMLLACKPTGTATDEELHDWTRTVLEYSHTGVELGCLGMLFERQGDAEMAQLAATEARERMHYPYVATWWPALQAWLDARPTATD